MRADEIEEMKRISATVDFSKLSEFFLELLFRPAVPVLGCPCSPRLLHSAALVVRFRLNLALGHFLNHTFLSRFADIASMRKMAARRRKAF